MLFSEPSTLSLEDVIRWQRICTSALHAEYSEAADAIGRLIPPKAIIADAVPRPTLKSLESYFQCGRAEVDLTSSFTLIAAAEAKIRLDAAARAARPSRSEGLGQRISMLLDRASRQWHVPLYENGILDVWKHQGHCAGQSSLPNAIGNFSRLLHVRHWTAHGRYWGLKADLLSLDSTRVIDVITHLNAELSALCVSMGWPDFPSTTPCSFNNRT
jgi:hypothetical protein